MDPNKVYVQATMSNYLLLLLQILCCGLMTKVWGLVPSTFSPRNSCPLLKLTLTQPRRRVLSACGEGPGDEVDTNIRRGTSIDKPCRFHEFPN